MFKYLLVLVLALPAHAERLDPEAPDKQMHFLASYSINTTFIAAMPKRAKYKKLKAASATAAIGVAKEFSDPQFSGADLAADGLGILTSSFFSLAFEF
jgi:hypothetical protein